MLRARPRPAFQTRIPPSSPALPMASACRAHRLRLMRITGASSTRTANACRARGQRPILAAACGISDHTVDRWDVRVELAPVIVPRAEDRARADRTWRKMEPLPAEEQEACVDVLLGDERSWALEERLRTAAEAATAHRAEASLRLARLAVRVAEHAPQDRRGPGRVTRPLYRTAAPPRADGDRKRSR